MYILEVNFQHIKIIYYTFNLFNTDNRLFVTTKHFKKILRVYVVLIIN